MKYLIPISLIVIFSSCFQNHKSLKTGLEGKPIPAFNLLLMDSITKINTQNISTNQPIVFFFVSPYCPYCKSQTEEIVNNLEALSKIRFYIISTFPYKPFKQYFDFFKLGSFTNVTVGRDYESFFPTYFQVTSIPYIAVYSKEKILKRVLIGKVPSNLLRDIALE
jgi:thiol-disulfide isomerase/thioredoxin